MVKYFSGSIEVLSQFLQFLDRINSFGVNDGVARGIQVLVYETGEPAELLWGIVKADKVIETKTVSTRLMPGTALNVTMWGNYTSSEGPYVNTFCIFH